MSNTRPNPYPGPRAFERGEKLYGRARETAELLDLFIAERIVLLSSPSGAGKTSLVQAALVPELEREGFRVLPVMRPGLPPDSAAAGANRYVLSLLLRLEKNLPAAEQTPLAELTGLSLAGYLDRLPAPATGTWHGDVLIFDQFEETLTVDPTDRAAKLAFFEQIGAALRDRNRWALFSMREEFVAALDPYLRPIPARFDKGRRYRLDLLDADNAREAMQRPAVDGGVTFTEPAARKLADDLGCVQVQQPDGTMTPTQGQVVEPVQLQVVCRRLWDRLTPDKVEIDVDDVEGVGDVDSALAGYYADTVAQVAGAQGVRERAIREWTDRQLISEGGIRVQVLMGPEASQGLNNMAIWPLVDAHLVRAEQRRGATWFELAHDRLLAPLRGDNAAWFEANLSTLQRQAALWEGQKRTDGLLLKGEALANAERWAQPYAGELEPHEFAFLDACRAARTLAVRERRQQRRMRLLAVAATILSIIAAMAAILAVAKGIEAEKQAQVARSGRAAWAAAAVSRQDPELSILLSSHALTELAYTPQAEQSLRDALVASRIVRGSDPQLLSPLRQTTFSADGTRVAIASEDGVIQVRESQTNNLIRRFDLGEERWIGRLRFGPRDSGLFAASSDSYNSDDNVKVWRIASGEELASFSPTGGVNDLVFSPDAHVLAVAQDDDMTCLWDLTAAGESQCFPLSAALIEYSPNGDYVAIASKVDTTVGTINRLALWNKSLAQELNHWDVLDNADNMMSVTFSPDGMMLAVAGQSGVELWDITEVLSQTLVPASFDHGIPVNGVAFSPDSECLASARDDQTAVVWKKDGTRVVTLSGHASPVYGVTFLQDGVASSNPAVEPCGTRLATIAGDTMLREWNIGASYEYQTLLGNGDPVETMEFSPKGDYLVAAGDAGIARVWNIPRFQSPPLPLQQRTALTHTARVADVDVSPDGKFIVAVDEDGAAVIWDALSGRPKQELKGGHEGIVSAVAFRPPTGEEVATTGEDGRVILWNVETGERLEELFQIDIPSFYSIAFNQDGSQIVAAAAFGRSVQFDMASKRSFPLDDSGSATAYAASFDPSGTHVYAVYDGGTIKVQPVGSERLAVDFSELGATAYSLDIATDGALLAVGGKDGTVKVWDVASHQIRMTLAGSATSANSVRFSPDDRLLAVGHDDGTVRLYLVNEQDLLEYAAKVRVTRSLSPDECKTYDIQCSGTN